MMPILIFAAIWVAISAELMLTGRAGYTITGAAPKHIYVMAFVSTLMMAPAFYLYVLITGKDVGNGR